MASKKTEELLIPRDDYLSAGCHIGLVQKTKDMKRFIYMVRPTGLAVLDISMLDQRIRIAAGMIANAKNILVVSRKEGGHRAVRAFAEATGSRFITGRFMPGSMTNPTYKGFFEPDLLLSVDPTSDKQAIKEAVRMRIPIIAMVDTINSLSFVELAIPCNNKSKEAIGTVMWVLAKEVNRIKGVSKQLKREDFTPTEEEKQRDRERAEMEEDVVDVPEKFHRKTTRSKRPGRR